MTKPTPQDIAPEGPMDREIGEVLPPSGAAPDWESLRSRLFATRHIQGQADAGDAPDGALRLPGSGSFASDAASAMTTYGNFSMFVNPSASSNLKSADAKRAPVAGRHTTGGRGR
ncbi:hypothetical protein [Novosphingobium colocasiae]|uniref:Uncharacterized protein n=1 Tax=Novosphingobium colocasiae TaxID=1256513 RepID=A0A918PDM1_9SPHN|nr:hypothetical protein [Novosphingobium colocasiae]GGZ00159.1 hypothetical protein GCM10011614_13970 [Novosphingobium colocasiae]